MVDIIFNSGTTETVSNYSSGTFDCRGTPPAKNTGVVNLTLQPQTDGTSPPDSNESTVYGCFGALNLTLTKAGAGGTPALDGSHTSFVYSDGADDDSGEYTGHTSLHLNSLAQVTINQLHGGNNVSWSVAQAYLTANPSLSGSPGLVVQDVGGTWVRFGPDLFPPNPSIEADINALTFIQTNSTLFTHGMVVIVDTNGTYVIEDATLGAASGAMVRPTSGADNTGVFIRDITAAQLTTHASFDGTYLTLS